MLGFAYRQLILTPQLPRPVDLAGKTALVTGGTSGLGFECAFQLLQMGLSRLLITSRSSERCQHAKEALLARLQRHPGTSSDPEIFTYELDHCSFESVCDLSTQLKESYQGALDIVVLNAGIRRWFPSTAPTGYEEMVQVNHLSTALLTILFRPLVKHGGRIVVNSSELHGHTDFRQRNEENALKYIASTSRTDFNVDEQYGLSKLLNILFTRELAARVPEDEVAITIVNPGLVITGLGMKDVAKMPKIQKYLGLLFVKIFARKTDIGGRTLTDAALREPVSQGEYLNGRGINLACVGTT